MHSGHKYRHRFEKKPRAAALNHVTSQRSADTAEKVATLRVQVNEVNWPHTMKEEVITLGRLLPVARKHCCWKATKKKGGGGYKAMSEQTNEQPFVSCSQQGGSSIEKSESDYLQCNCTIAFPGTSRRFLHDLVMKLDSASGWKKRKSH